MLFALAALFLTVAAIDVMWVHRVAGPPEVDENTQQLTTRGLSQQRTDFMWGTFFLVSAGVLTGVAFAGLVGRRPVLELDRDEIRLRVVGPRSFLRIPWGNVRWVHSGADGDDELVPTRVLLVNVYDASAYPRELWGAQWDHRTVMIDADSWNVTPEEIVTHAQRALDAWRRDLEDADEDQSSSSDDAGSPGEPVSPADDAVGADPVDEQEPAAAQQMLFEAGGDASDVGAGDRDSP